MEEIQNKFINFKKFILTIDDKNDWVIWFQNVDLTSFILNIKTKNHLEDIEIFNQLIETTNIDKNKLNESINDKLKRYISYFKQISNIL